MVFHGSAPVKTLLGVKLMKPPHPSIRPSGVITSLVVPKVKHHRRLNLRIVATNGDANLS